MLDEMLWKPTIRSIPCIPERLIMGNVADRTFRKPVVISSDSEILGIKARDWDKALVGNMAQELAEIETKIQAAIGTDQTGCEADNP